MNITKGEMRDLARSIADDLFINGQGKEADRLVLWVDATNGNLGGWCKRAVVEIIVDKLKASAS